MKDCGVVRGHWFCNDGKRQETGFSVVRKLWFGDDDNGREKECGIAGLWFRDDGPGQEKECGIVELWFGDDGLGREKECGISRSLWFCDDGKGGEKESGLVKLRPCQVVKVH